MANSYSWKISAIDCYPEFEGKQNVVFMVHWRRKAEAGGGQVTETYGEQPIKFNPDSPFTAFDGLTQAQVENWLELEMGPDRLAEINAILDAQMDEIVNPSVVVKSVPWAES